MEWMVDPEIREHYELFCRQAARSETVFADFRDRAMIVGVMEHVSREEANHFLDHLEEQWPGWFSEAESTLARLDAVGRNLMSPTMIRYAYRARDLHAWCPSLDGGRIVEIGGGYGGLAAVVKSFYSPASYSIIDIGHANELQAKYLAAAGIEGVTYLRHPEDAGEIDLLIADFSLCELDAEWREFYANWLFPTAKYGALLWSERPEVEGWLVGDNVGAWLQSHLSGSQVHHPPAPSDRFIPRANQTWWSHRWYWKPEETHARHARAR